MYFLPDKTIFKAPNIAINHFIYLLTWRPSSIFSAMTSVVVNWNKKKSRHFKNPYSPYYTPTYHYTGIQSKCVQNGCTIITPEPEGFRRPKWAQRKAGFHGNHVGRYFWGLEQLCQGWLDSDVVLLFWQFNQNGCIVI